MMIDEREQEINRLKEPLSIKDHELVVREKTIAILEDEIELLKMKLCGRRSEKYSLEEEFQSSLFDEAELGSTEPEEEQTIEVPSHIRKRRGHRKPLPESIPRKIVLHDIPESEKQCGEEVSEKLAIIPGSFYVERHVRPKYACEDKACIESEGGSKAVIIAPPAPTLIPKSMATPSLLAFLFTSKFCDSLPFYRMTKILTRMGADISRQTMCRWAHVWRKFHEALKATKKKTGSSREGMAWVQKLYAVEREADKKNLTPEERKKLRADKSAPILEKFKAWPDKKVLTVAPKTLLGKEINYTLKLWDGLIRFLDDGRIPIDNNGAENAVRPFAVGRINRLFVYTPAGARIYSIIQTAILNGLEPFWYMNFDKKACCTPGGINLEFFYLRFMDRSRIMDKNRV